MESLTNVTFDEIKVGDTATVKRRLSKTEVEALALVGGDVDAFQISEQPAKDEMHTDAVGAEALLSGLLNRKLPGPGTSIAATRALKRACWRSRPRSSAAIHPAAWIEPNAPMNCWENFRWSVI